MPSRAFAARPTSRAGPGCRRRETPVRQPQRSEQPRWQRSMLHRGEKASSCVETWFAKNVAGSESLITSGTMLRSLVRRAGGRTHQFARLEPIGSVDVADRFTIQGAVPCVATTAITIGAGLRRGPSHEQLTDCRAPGPERPGRGLAHDRDRLFDCPFVPRGHGSVDEPDIHDIEEVRADLPSAPQPAPRRSPRAQGVTARWGCCRRTAGWTTWQRGRRPAPVSADPRAVRAARGVCAVRIRRGCRPRRESCDRADSPYR